MDSSHKIGILVTVFIAMCVYQFVPLTSSVPASTLNPQHVLIVSMVRNEERILGRMIQSVQTVLPGANFFFCDTGSRDKTISIFLAVPTHIGSINHKWENFEVNRNKCLVAARDTLRAQGYSHVRYIFFMDADQTMERVKVDTIPLAPVSADVNTIQIRSASDELPHNSLSLLLTVSASEECKYELWTHEILQCSHTLSHDYYRDIQLVHHRDGSSYGEKHERDIKLLTDWLSEVNSGALRPRALFHLAQAHHALKNYEQALVYYRKHISIERYTNYRYQSRYHVGKVLLAQNVAFEVIERAFMDSIDLEQDGVFRWESYYHLARISRQTGRINKCLLYSGAALSAPALEHERMPLFIEASIYNWRLELERAHCFFLSDRKAKALVMYEELLARPSFKNAESRAWLEKELDYAKQIVKTINA